MRILIDTNILLDNITPENFLELLHQKVREN